MLFNWLKKPKNLSAAVQIGLMLAVLVLIAPVAFSILKASLALLITGLIGMSVVFFGPAVGDWFAAMRLKSIKAVAAANPIETLEQNLISATEVIRNWKQDLKEFDAAVAQFVGMAKELIQKYPEKKDEYVRQVAGRQELRKRRVAAIKAAEEEIHLKENQLEQLKAEYRVAQAANELDRKASKFDNGARFDSTRIDSAVQSIRTEVHTSMASCGTLFQDMDFDPNKALELDDESYLMAQQSLGLNSSLSQGVKL